MGADQSTRKVVLGSREFVVENILGKGSYGRVFLLSEKDSGVFFALKSIDKGKLVLKGKATVRNALREKNLLSKYQHPFLVNLLGTIQDDDTLYMVMDMMMGGELKYHMKGPMPEKNVLFYIANILISLEHIHSYRIIHRDIKPQNILMDERGYLHLTDFNISAELNDRPNVTSYAGTPPYVAPEIFQKFPYALEVDMWSLGVLMYEMLYGKLPWSSLKKSYGGNGAGKSEAKAEGKQSDKEEGKEEEKEEVCSPKNEDDDEYGESGLNLDKSVHVDWEKKYGPEMAALANEVIAMDIKYPDSIEVSADALDFLKKLLCPREKRLAAHDCFDHPWIKSIDFDSIRRLEMKAPFIPNVDQANVDRNEIVRAFMEVESEKSMKKVKLTDEQQSWFAKWDWISPQQSARLKDVTPMTVVLPTEHSEHSSSMVSEATIANATGPIVWKVSFEYCLS